MAEVSLIPKKFPTGQAIDSGGGIFLKASIAFFVVSVLATGGLYVWKNILTTNLSKQEATLKNLQNQFPPETIKLHEEVGRAIASSKQLVRQHNERYLQTGVFEFLENNTLTEIKFSSFNYNEQDRKIQLIGEAPSYTAIAQQASILEKTDDVASVTFSNMTLSAKGTVGFTLIINRKMP